MSKGQKDRIRNTAGAVRLKQEACEEEAVREGSEETGWSSPTTLSAASLGIWV